MFRYFRLILLPSVMKRNRKQPKQHDQINASKLYCECKCTESCLDENLSKNEMYAQKESPSNLEPFNAQESKEK